MIFGSSYPQIDSQALGGEIPLQNSTVTRKPVRYKHDFVMNKSDITGRKHLHYRGKHLVFEFMILDATRNLMEALAIVQGTEVSLRPYSENENRTIPCYVTKADPFYYKDLNCADAVILELESIDYWTDTAATMIDEDTGGTPIGTYEGYLIDESGNFLVDENGDKLIINQIDKEA